MPQAPDSVQGLVDGVKQLGQSDPMLQIGNALERVGSAVQRGADWAKDKAGELAAKVTKTPQGTTRGTAPKTRMTDIELPATQRKRLKKVRLEKSSNGGFIASHHYHPERGGTPAPDRHAFQSYDDLHKHLEGLK
jgi:hypothetical protein